MRKEARAVRWLAGKGLPAGAVRLLFWVVKLTMVVVLLYSAFWLALLLVFAVTAAWLVRFAAPLPLVAAAIAMREPLPPADFASMEPVFNPPRMVCPIEPFLPAKAMA